MRYRPPSKVVDGFLLVGYRSGNVIFLKTERPMRYTYQRLLWARKQRSRYRPPHPRRAVDCILLMVGRNEGGMFLRTGRSTRYMHQGSLEPQIPRLRHQPHRPRQLVDGMHLVRGGNDGGFLETRGGCGMPTGDHAACETAFLLPTTPPDGRSRWLTLGGRPKWRQEEEKCRAGVEKKGARKSV